MAPPTYEFLKSENTRLNGLLVGLYDALKEIPGEEAVDKILNLKEAMQGPPSSASGPGELYLGKTAQQWSEIAVDTQREVERLKNREPSEGQRLADIMKFDRENRNAGKVGAAV